MNRWQLFEILKGNKEATVEDINNIEKMDNTEAKEAIIEIVYAIKNKKLDYSFLSI